MTLQTDLDADLAYVEAKAKLAATTLLAKYALTWPYWAPVVVIAALIGHAL